LLSSNQHEVRRLLAQARQWADRLGKPVLLWLSDKQDAFLKGIALEFPGVPHRYCANHFLRDLAKPMLAADSNAKVQMRRKVRGLRQVEQAALKQLRRGKSQPEIQQQDESTSAAARASAARGCQAAAGDSPGVNEATAPKASREEQVAQVVLDYCACVRGILNDDQGGPLSPPGLRMAKALVEVRASLSRNLELNKPGPGHKQLARLADCIDRGLAAVKTQQEEISEQAKEVGKVALTLDESAGSLSERKAKYEQLRQEYEKKDGPFFVSMAKMMASWEPGLFVELTGQWQEKLPMDNLELERWFRQPKRHERRIHGRRHAGVRIVQEGATLLPTLNAHETHPEPFTAEELLPYRHAREPLAQTQAMQRRKIMRKARSKKNAPFSSQS
jgi:hypothetical protein